MSEPFVCTECGHRAALAADCGCGAGPLVDLRDAGVRAVVRDIEDRRVDKRLDQYKWVGVVAGVIAIGVALSTDLLRAIVLAAPLPIPFANPIKFLAVGVLAALGVWKGLAAALPPPRRFPEA